MSDDTSQDKIVFKPSGREKMRCTAAGPTIHYTYATAHNHGETK